MDRASSGILMLVAGLLLIAGGAYLFLNSPVGGVNSRTVGPFAALLIGLVLVVLGKSRMAAGRSWSSTTARRACPETPGTVPLRR